MMPGVRRLGVVVGAAGLVAVSLAAASASARTDAASVVKLAGKATFPATDGSTSCSFKPVGNVVEEVCVPGFGVFTGKPARAGASVRWVWKLEIVDGVTTGNGTETAVLKLNFGGGKTVDLALTGTIKPAGPQSQAGGTTVSTGTWKVKKARGFSRTLTAALIKGKGTYRGKHVRKSNTYPAPEYALAGRLT
jgi:hypothetical protein